MYYYSHFTSSDIRLKDLFTNLYLSHFVQIPPPYRTNDFSTKELLRFLMLLTLHFYKNVVKIKILLEKKKLNKRNNRETLIHKM